MRSFDNGDSSEGISADDELQRVYVSEEEVGLWRYGAEPGDGSTRSLVDRTVATGGRIVENVKNTAIYYGRQGAGYLIVSSQGGSNFVIYNRGDNAYVGSFKITDGGGVDGVNGQDGIDVNNFPLGPSYPAGLFTSQDHNNTNAGNGNSGNQNHKLVSWQRIADAFSPRLLVDTTFDPRQIGAAGGGGNPAPGTPPPPDTSTTSPIAVKKAASLNGALGAATTAEVYGLKDNGGFQCFQRGCILYSPATGAHVSLGAIRGKWAETGFENGRLGYPVTDEVGGLRDGGVFQNYQGGTIMYSPATGAHISVGAIRSRWAESGYENGRLGYPVSDEVGGLRDGGVFQNYQGGAIMYSPASGAHLSVGGIRTIWASTGERDRPPRLPHQRGIRHSQWEAWPRTIRAASST